MTPRRRAILIVALAALVLALVVLVVLMLARRTAPEPAPTGEIIEPTGIEDVPVAAEPFENPLILPSVETPGNTAGRQVAELFAERYGSYSNQGNYQNLRDLLPIMTAEYRSRTEAFLASASSEPGEPYEGVTSVRISTETRSMDDDEAVIAVSLQQQKSVGTAAPTIAYRTLRMELERVGDRWLVADARWEG